MKLRGPGDFFGQRQHGLPQLKIADMTTDMEVLRQAQACAKKLLAENALELRSTRACEGKSGGCSPKLAARVWCCRLFGPVGACNSRQSVTAQRKNRK